MRLDFPLRPDQHRSSPNPQTHFAPNQGRKIAWDSPGTFHPVSIEQTNPFQMTRTQKTEQKMTETMTFQNPILTAISPLGFKTMLKDALLEILGEMGIGKSAPEKEILTVKEAADFLGCAVNTLYEKTSKRLVPFYKKGKTLYFKRAELTGWIEEGRVESAAELQMRANTHRMLSRRKSA